MLILGLKPRSHQWFSALHPEWVVTWAVVFKLTLPLTTDINKNINISKGLFTLDLKNGKIILSTKLQEVHVRRRTVECYRWSMGSHPLLSGNHGVQSPFVNRILCFSKGVNQGRVPTIQELTTNQHTHKNRGRFKNCEQGPCTTDFASTGIWYGHQF